MCQLFSSLIFCLFVFLVLLAMVLLSLAVSPLLDTISQLFCAMSNYCIYFDLRLVVFMHKFLYALGKGGVHGGILSLQIIYQSSRYHFVFIGCSVAISKYSYTRPTKCEIELPPDNPQSIALSKKELFELDKYNLLCFAVLINFRKLLFFLEVDGNKLLKFS